MKAISCILFTFLMFSSPVLGQNLITFSSPSSAKPTAAGCYFSNSVFVESTKGVLVKYICYNREDIYNEIWLVGEDNSKRLHRSEIGRLFSQPIEFENKFYFTEYSVVKTEKIWVYDQGNLFEIELTGEYKGSYINDFGVVDGKLWFRYRGGQTKAYGQGFLVNGQFQNLSNEGTSFFFNASSNDEAFIQKIRQGEVNGKQDQIVGHFFPDFEKQVLLKTKSLDPSSPFTHLRNVISLNKTHWAVVATTEAGPVLIRGESANRDMTPLHSNFSKIDYWSGALDSKNRYYFRATHKDGRRGLWSIDLEGKILLVLGVGQAVRVDQSEVFVSRRSPFYNSPLIVDDFIYIGAGIDSTQNGEIIGQGIIKIKL